MARMVDDSSYSKSNGKDMAVRNFARAWFKGGLRESRGSSADILSIRPQTQIVTCLPYTAKAYIPNSLKSIIMKNDKIIEKARAMGRYENPTYAFGGQGFYSHVHLVC